MARLGWIPFLPGGVSMGKRKFAVPDEFGDRGLDCAMAAAGSASLMSFSEVGICDCVPGCSGVGIVALMKSVK